MPFALAANATSRAMAGVLVLESRMIVPGAAALTTPLAPSITSLVAMSSDTIEQTNSAPFAAAAGESQTCMPLSANGFVFSLFLLKTLNECPAACRFIAMREPIAPNPMNATVLMDFLSSFFRLRQQSSQFGIVHQADALFHCKCARIVGEIAGRYIDGFLRFAGLPHGIELPQRLHAGARHLPALAADQRNAA